MTPDTIDMIRQILPETQAFPYYDGREDPWLLAERMRTDTAPVADLRAGPAAPLLSRPLVQPVVAACGGTLAQRDMTALAHADRAIRLPGVSRAARPALDAIYSAPWADYTLSLAAWGTDRYWQYNQLSRRGGNLVLQLGFPSTHAQAFGRYFPPSQRGKYETSNHPIRTTGAPTLAWARLDLDLDTGHGLIEEVQSDWLRYVSRETLRMAARGAQDRELRIHIAYEQALIATYAKSWARVTLLAALMLMRNELGLSTIWMHQPGPGAALKQITGRPPPRSLYRDLPRRFGFAPTRDAPPFLEAPRRRALALLRNRPEPLFWRLAL